MYYRYTNRDGWIWEVWYRAEYVSDKLPRRWDSCNCMCFSKTFYTTVRLISRRRANNSRKKEFKTVNERKKEFGSFPFTLRRTIEPSFCATNNRSLCRGIEVGAFFLGLYRWSLGRWYHDPSGGIVFSMNSKSKCTYKPQEQKKTSKTWKCTLRLGVEPSLCAY